jgi:hypothetical protein
VSWRNLEKTNNNVTWHLRSGSYSCRFFVNWRPITVLQQDSSSQTEDVSILAGQTDISSGKRVRQKPSVSARATDEGTQVHTPPSNSTTATHGNLIASSPSVAVSFLG